MSTDYLSPLRYPGAKRKIANHILSLLQEHGYKNSVFVEPCCGGASVSLYLLDKEAVSSVILIDKDPWIVSFWYMLFFETDSLMSDIRNVDVVPETWRAFREREPQTRREKALYCFFFNRTCFSGIIRAGMIGGNEQASQYKMDCRFNKRELLDRIKIVAERFCDNVLDVREDSVFDVLERAKSEEQENYIYYIDPPYVKKGLRLYFHNFQTEEHLRLSTILNEFNKPWILSYHDHELVRKMYLQDASLNSTILDVIWVANGHNSGKELLISNLPEIRKTQPTSPVPTLESELTLISETEPLPELSLQPAFQSKLWADLSRSL